LRLRLVTTSYLEQAHYLRGEYERVIGLAPDNLAALPADWVHEYFVGVSTPTSVFDRSWLAVSLAHLGRFAEAAEYAAEAVRLAETTNRAFPVGVAYRAAVTLRLLKGDWAMARSLLEHGITVARAGNVVFNLPGAVASSAWALAQLDEASEALNRLGEGEQLLDHQATRGLVDHHGWSYHSLVALVCGSVGLPRRNASASARSNRLRINPDTRPMLTTCSATSRPIPTGSMSRAARPIIARR